MIRYIDSLWRKQLQLARSRFTSVHARFRGRAAIKNPDVCVVTGYHPLKYRNKAVPYVAHELERLSRKHGISLQDWRPRRIVCLNCGARRGWRHPDFDGGVVCDRCTFLN